MSKGNAIEQTAGRVFISVAEHRTDYILAEGWAKTHTDAKKELLERVNERMEEGYMPVGGVNVTTILKHAVIGEFHVILYSQGMMKHEQE